MYVVAIATDPQELARRFNEDEAVWRRFQQKRKLRMAMTRKLGKRSRLSKKALDVLWRAAERECRPVRAIGVFLSPPPEAPKQRIGFHRAEHA